MRKIAFADLVREWEALLAAVDDHQDRLAGAVEHRARLESHLDEIREVKAKQAGARALQQVCTKRLAELAADGQVAAIQLRGAVRSFIGAAAARTLCWTRPRLRSRTGGPATRPTERPGIGDQHLLPAGAADGQPGRPASQLADTRRRSVCEKSSPLKSSGSRLERASA